MSSKLIEHDFNALRADYELAVRAIDAIKESDQIAVFRGGLAFQTPSEWLKFMRDRCALQHDTRHFGFSEDLQHSDWWEISNQPEKESSYAYSTTPQPFHTDNGWFARPPEINFFIMQRQAPSGGQQMVYHVGDLVADLTREDPALLDDLASVRVRIQKGDTGEYNDTTILRDIDSDAPKVFWNYYRTVRSSDRIDHLCERFFTFLRAHEYAPSVYELHMRDGDCFLFNDTRILHGRRAFVASQPRERVLLQSMWKIPER